LGEEGIEDGSGVGLSPQLLASLGPVWGPLCFTGNTACFSWAHDREQVNGWINFLDGGVLTTSFGDGSWELLDDDGTVMQLTFGTSICKCRLSNAGRFVVEAKNFRDGTRRNCGQTIGWLGSEEDALGPPLLEALGHQWGSLCRDAGGTRFTWSREGHICGWINFRRGGILLTSFGHGTWQLQACDPNVMDLIFGTSRHVCRLQNDRSFILEDYYFKNGRKRQIHHPIRGWLIHEAPILPVRSEVQIEENVRRLQQTVKEQEGMAQGVRRTLRLLMDRCLHESAGAEPWQDVQQPYILKEFGSRSSGYALPHSDLDLVLELWPQQYSELDHHKRSVIIAATLKALLHQIRDDASVTDVKDQIEGKSTICFKFCKTMMVDCTANVGYVSRWHRPWRTSNTIGKALKRYPDQVTALAILVVDAVKKTSACWNREGGVGARLKGVNWVQMVIAWYKAHATQFRESGLLVWASQTFNFYAQFRFEDSCISAFHGEPFTTRSNHQQRATDGGQIAMWITDSLSHRNCVERVTAEELARIRKHLQNLSASFCYEAS